MDSSSDKDQADNTITDSTQVLDFSCHDGQRLDVVPKVKDLVVKSGGRTHGNTINFNNWEQDLYMGQLIAVHRSGDFLAYAVKIIAFGPDTVRVVQRSTGKHTLLRGMQGSIHDLSFAFITQQVLLACIDDTSSFYIYKLYSQTDTIVSELVFSVDGNSNSVTNHIVWCSYVPEKGEEGNEEEDEEESKYLVSTCGPKAYIWNINEMVNKFGSGPHPLSRLATSSNTVDHHSQDILQVAISPDATILATASRDGLVKFFKAFFDDNERIKCIHQWSPHNYKPVSSLIFLDSLSSDSELFWEYVVTASDNVVKIWSCKDWSCLQKITFASGSMLKLGLSRCAELILVSDILMRDLYVLKLTPNTCTSVCQCTSITHFYLPFSCLGFADIQIGRKVSNCAEHNNADHMLELEDTEEENREVLHMFMLHT